MSYRVRIESFEGPFDLLLYLVSRQKVDIKTLSISDIVDQYLSEVSAMKSLDLDVASDFLLVAATLLKIKAESLLDYQNPELDDELEELAPSEARDILVERLLTYKCYKNASVALQARFEAEGRMHVRPFGPDACFLTAVPDYTAQVSLSDLAKRAALALARREVFLLEAEHIAAKPIPVETYVRSIRERISREKRLCFFDLVGRDAPPRIIVVVLLALLELYKRSEVNLRQDHAFGDIDVYFCESTNASKATDSSVFEANGDTSAHMMVGEE